MIPAEAIESAAKLLYIEDHLWDEPWETVSCHIRERYQARALVALEAVMPLLLSHEREQTRLAHLDAMVNRETKREELAQARAQALEDAADIADRPENKWWAEGMQRAKWLRSLAAAERGER
jgi:hypothetical protein